MGDHLSGTEIRAIIDKTNKKNPAKADLEALRKALKNQPNFWRVGGDLVHHAQMHLIKSSVDTAAGKESIECGLEVLRKDLGYKDAPFLERLLIEQVVLCWLRLNLTEYQYTAASMQSGSFERFRYWEQRLNAAQMRYLRAIETLARVRKLARTTPLQVNIGGQQVIAAGDVHGGR